MEKNIAVGDSCFYYTFSGAVKVKFLAIEYDSYMHSDYAMLEITEDFKAYKKGEKIRTSSLSRVVHSKSLIRKGHGYAIRNDYTLDGRQIFNHLVRVGQITRDVE